jgi:enoyl-CoA hydratase/carnithine racemase
VALEGRLVPPREALQLGILHEVVPEAELLPRALARATALAALPPAGVRMVKAALRRAAAAAARAAEESEAERWLDTWFAEESRRRLREAVARLRRD